MTAADICARTACQSPLKRGYYRIWNQGTSEPRLYCVRCGRRIVEYNEHDTFKLKYEVVKPERPTPASVDQDVIGQRDTDIHNLPY